MKKTFCVLLAVCMTALLLCGCGASARTPYFVSAPQTPALKDSESADSAEASEPAAVETTEAAEVFQPAETTEETKPEHVHSYTEETVKPTCTQRGYTRYTCECGDTYRDHWVSAQGHAYVSTVVAPTYSAQGYTQHACPNCGDNYRDTYTAKLTPAHTHSYSAQVTAPTCIAKGYTTYTCACGATYIGNETSALGHDDRDTVVAPTQSAQGYTEHTCTRCGRTVKDAFTNKLPAHTHVYTMAVTAPTCTAKGYTTYTCSCGSSYTADEVSAAGHDYEAIVTAPTEDAQGYTEHVCRTCGSCYRDSFVAALHVHNYTVSTKAPTCTEAGTTTYTCACGDSYQGTETLALGHDYEETVLAPSTDMEGYTLHTCTRCGDSYKDAYTDPLPPFHEHEYYDFVTAPTCTEGGYTLHACPCAVSYTDSETPALGHDYAETVIAPTEEAEGYTEHTCTRCGDSYRDSYTAAQPHTHNFSNPVIVQESTCKDKGIIRMTCSCGEYNEVVTSVDYDAHVYEQTGENDGYTIHTCSVCGKVTYKAKTNDIYALINARRAEAGLAPIQYYSAAQPAADLRVQEIQTLFAHIRPNGTSCFTVTAELGIPGFFQNENIGSMYPSAEAMVEGWMNSPGHRANLLDPDINAMVVSTSRNYWVFMGFVI